MHLVVVGGSDAGISAALRARELAPEVAVTVVVADGYPNFSICGIPYHVSGEVPDWRSLAHRTADDLAATGMRVRTGTLATRIDVPGHRVLLRTPGGSTEALGYDRLVVGTGAAPVRPAVTGLVGDGALGAGDGVHLLHTMGDTFALTGSIERLRPRTALVVGAGYVGLEMAEALTTRGLAVAQAERLPEVLPTVDPELGGLVRAELVAHGVQVVTGVTVESVARAPVGAAGRLRVAGAGPDGPYGRDVDLALVSVGVRPDTELLVGAGARTGPRGAVLVDEGMRTGLADVWAAGDCVVTHHRLTDPTWLPLGSTAHKQGRIAGENAVGGDARYAGSLGTQVVKVFDLVAARTGLREHEARAAGFAPVTTAGAHDDHKAYYPGAHPISARITGDAGTGRLLGAQLVGRLGTEVAKRIDVLATALHHGTPVAAIDDLDLSYTPPLGSPWDVVQLAAQAWTAEHRPPTQRLALARPPTHRREDPP